uniref:FACT complex subunit SSRP1 n=1 Tax=Cannabis sativa TaxID=3483 RepID=A0A803RBI9_CANSA
MHYFDLLIRLKTEQEHLFRNIQRNEYHNLFDFMSGKGLKIMNLGNTRPTDGVASVLQDEDDDAVDPHLVRVKNEAGDDESDEEDEDFVAKRMIRFPTDDSGKMILMLVLVEGRKRSP